MRKAPIAAGVAMPAGATVLVVLTWNGGLVKGITGAPENPVVHLAVGEDMYALDNNSDFCGQCDILTYARVVSSPPIEIVHGSEMALEIDSRTVSTQYALFEYSQIEGDDKFLPSGRKL